MRKQKLLLIIGILALAAFACDLSSLGLSPDVVAPDPGEIATAVALTLEASGGSLPGDTPGDSPGDPPPAPPVLRIVYVDDGDLWLWTEGVGASEIFDDATNTVRDVHISDDGLVVAFILNNGYDFVGFWAINSDGSNPRQLVDAATVTAMGTNPSAVGTVPSSWDFIPGSHIVAFNTRQFYEGPGLDIQDDLRLIDTDSDTLTTLLAPGDGGQFYYSPDGSQIAVVTPTTISLMNADGSNLRADVLTYTSLITYSEYLWYALPRWSSDGSYLRVVIPFADIIDPAATDTVWHIPTDGSAATSLGSTAAIGTHFNQVSTISPDMNKFAFQRQVGSPTSNILDIRFVDLTSFVDSSYVIGGVSFEVWGPDSSQFVYKQDGHLFVGQSGAPPIALLDTNRGIDPTWVDANRVLYLSGYMASWELRLRTVGVLLVVIANPIGDFVAYDFSN